MSAHAMPFGAAYDAASGRTRFRLWAPDADAVALELDGVEHPLSADADGWYGIELAAAPGARYGYRVGGGLRVPDPASRYNPDGVHAASAVVDPDAFDWGVAERGWRGRPWSDAVVYELHVGAFAGDYAGVERRLDYLAELGVTALELMPLAAFGGARGWGYDGVLHYAPHAAYGTPEQLKRLVRAAHERGLMLLLDVVYNHFGPDGNYLHAYASRFFDAARQTPWGAAIDYAAPWVREYFVHNALYWLDEYRFDGLRLDAVHAIHDASATHLLDELADRVARGPGRDRAVHLVLENDDNETGFLRRGYRAQWNDDAHHVFHVLASGERDGYYRDYVERPVARLGRCLRSGFDYQGEHSAHRQTPRGTPSGDLPAAAFVNFLQNHDQIGNRAFGERLHTIADPAALRALQTLLLLAPPVPLLFMGEEFAASTPFLYFCDFDGELGAAVTAGRRREFAGFAAFDGDAAAPPDPNAAATFARSALDWREADTDAARGEHAAALRFHRRLLALRRDLVARYDGVAGAALTPLGATALRADWVLADGARLRLLGNFAATPCTLAEADAAAAGAGTALCRVVDGALDARPDDADRGLLHGWDVRWRLL